MDVFIPEDYVTRRRLEKKLAASVASANKGSQTAVSHSHWNNSNIDQRIRNGDNKGRSFTHPQEHLDDNNVFFPSSNKGLTLVDDPVFICFSA